MNKNRMLKYYRGLLMRKNQKRLEQYSGIKDPELLLSIARKNVFECMSVVYKEVFVMFILE